MFQNNATAVFSCSGNGYVVSWFLNGSGYNPENALMGITVVPGTNSKSETSSRLYVSSNPTYNNTEVYCKVIDINFTNIQTSGLTNLAIQGKIYRLFW